MFDAGIFRLREDLYELRGKPVHPYYVLESRPWVNVVAVTEQSEVVLVRQFRHGIEDESLEIPGGIVDPEDDGPAAAGARELLEESGYAGGEPRPLLSVSSNPAILNNRTHSFVIEGARRVADPTPDTNEELTVELAPVEALPGLIRSGIIHHSLSVAALGIFLIDT